MKPIFRLSVIILIVCFAMSLSAQDDPADTCTIDLINAIRDLKAAQAEAQQDNLYSAVQLMESVQAQIADILAGCENLEIDLSQTGTAEDADFGYTFTVNYPEGWAFSDYAGLLSIANSEALLARVYEDELTLEDGQIVIIGLPLVGVTADALGLAEDATAADAVELISGIFFGGHDTETNFNDPENVELNGKSATIMSGSATVNGITAYGSTIAVQVDGGFAVFTARYNGDFDAEIRAIVGSAELSTTE
ncbi:MAG: hypothetical protein RLP44_16030 [Aggregatilineales bacterium]